MATARLFPAYQVPQSQRESNAALVPAIREAVHAWRSTGYEGATETSRRLLTYWFETDHLQDGEEWLYYYCQREAVETLVYLYEVIKARDLYTLAKHFGRQKQFILNPSEDRWARYVLKMATGSGKTKVMSLAIVWQYFNARFETGRETYTQTFALIAPNVIVYQRLLEDFRDGGMEGTGIGLRERMLSHGELMVLNDEGHHLHTDDLEWAKIIDRMDEELTEQTGRGLRAQLDFTATPKHTNGALFQEIVVDYPIAQAVEDGIVKRPILGELSGVREYEAENAADRHLDKLNAGIQKWREMRDALEETDRNPLLFIMTEKTNAADDIGDWLKTQPDFSEESVLVIHTNQRGEITEGVSKAKQKELEELREASRKVDAPDTPYRAIVSVLMLREGWDVRNVCVIVPLRAYSAKAQILPEQTLGRGLRRMWPVASGEVNERVIVIEHEAFHSFWDQELKEEGLDIERVPVAQIKPDITTVLVDPTKAQYDIEIPVVTPALTTRVPDLSEIDISKLPKGNIALGRAVEEDPISYTGRDMLTREVVEEAEFEREFPADPAGYLNVLARLALRECRLANLADGFAKLAPLMKKYIENRMFIEPVSMADLQVMIRLNSGDAKRILFDTFVVAIRELSIVEQPAILTGESIRVSKTEPFPTTRTTVDAEKTIFNHVPCDSELEEHFARWLDARAKDVLAFAKNEPAVHFNVPYISVSGALRYYRPDFVVRTPHAMYVVETKGLETTEVPRKDQRMAGWCQSVSALTGEDWRYVKVPDAVFRFSAWASMAELEQGLHSLDP